MIASHRSRLAQNILMASLLMASLVAGGAAQADTARPDAALMGLYSFELGSAGAERIALDLPREDGERLRIYVAWSGGRHLLMRLRGPDGRVARRSGPSPLTLDVHVEDRPNHSKHHLPTQLSLHALPGRGVARGTIEIRREDDASIEPGGITAAATIPADRAPVSSSIESVQTFVSHVTGDPSGPRDACGWQQPLVEYLRLADERLSQTARVPPIVAFESARWFMRLERLVVSIAEWRASKDPIVAGPPPDDPYRRRAWDHLRRERLAPIERELDSMAESLRAGYAPELSHAVWPQRLLSCLTACQRHFEELGRIGSEEASHRELAEAQWQRLQLAAAALTSLVQVDSPSKALPQD